MTESMTPSRDIREITAEIRTIQDSVRRTALSGAIEIGRRLTEAKELLQHGEWGDWLKREFEFSQSTASRLMQLFREYGADQGSLFGAETKYATLQNISVSNALRLIAIPDEEREEFAAEHDIEHKSAREVDELIRQRQEADARAAALEKELAEERERARKAAELQDADVSAFGVHFANVQRDFNDLLVALNKVRAAAPETGEKLTSAVRALVEKIGGTL